MTMLTSRGHCLSLYTAHTFSVTHKATILLNGEIGQLRTLVLQNRMALDMLTAAQEECVPSYTQNVVCTYWKLTTLLAQGPLFV